MSSAVPKRTPPSPRRRRSRARKVSRSGRLCEQRSLTTCSPPCRRSKRYSLPTRTSARPMRSSAPRAKAGLASCPPRGRLEQFDHDAVGIADVERVPPAVDAGVDLHRRAHERRDTMLPQVLVETGQVVDEEAEVRRSDVSGLDVGVVTMWCEVLEQLNHVFGARYAEVRHAHVRVRVADDRRKVAALLLLRREHLAAESVAVEGERAVEARDGVAGVMEPADRHRASARSRRSSTPPSGVTTNTFSTRAP